jgi:hypothetical protein
MVSMCVYKPAYNFDVTERDEGVGNEILKFLFLKKKHPSTYPRNTKTIIYLKTDETIVD